jgi:hypothetical protein
MTMLIVYIISAVITTFIASTLIFIFTKDWLEGLQLMGAAFAAGVFCFITVPVVIIVGSAWLLSNRIRTNTRKMGIHN